MFIAYFCIFWIHFFVNFLMCLIMLIFGVYYLRFFVFYFYFFVYIFLHFLLPPIVDVDISDIAIISVIPDMVKAIISGITNTPQKTYRMSQ